MIESQKSVLSLSFQAALTIISLSSRLFISLKGSIFAPSLLATDGFRCVSRKTPSAPAASDAIAIVEIIPGWPPVTPAV